MEMTTPSKYAGLGAATTSTLMNWFLVCCLSYVSTWGGRRFKSFR